MRKIVSKFFWPAFEVVIAGIFVVLVMPRNKDEKLVFTVENSDAVKMIDTTSKFFVDDILIDIEDKKEDVVEEKQEEVVEEKKEEVILTDENKQKEESKVVETPKVEEVKEVEKKEEEPKVEVKPVVRYDPIDTSNYPVLNSYSNLVMTGYGYDCRGCTTGKTASGYSIRDTIYYDDPTFGTLRIVAMDKSIPMYSIVRISNINGMEPILAIVLDRGGGISFSKSIQIDLVVESEAIAKTTIGKKYNVTCDILRSGK